jgi:hypothetical protein
MTDENAMSVLSLTGYYLQGLEINGKERFEARYTVQQPKEGPSMTL